MLGVQPLLGLPFLDPASQAIAAAASAGALAGGVLEEGEGGMAGLRVGAGGKVLTAQESLALMLANIKGLGEHKVKEKDSPECAAAARGMMRLFALFWGRLFNVGQDGSYSVFLKRRKQQPR